MERAPRLAEICFFSSVTIGQALAECSGNYIWQVIISALSLMSAGLALVVLLHFVLPYLISGLL